MVKLRVKIGDFQNEIKMDSILSETEIQIVKYKQPDNRRMDKILTWQTFPGNIQVSMTGVKPSVKQIPHPNKEAVQIKTVNDALFTELTISLSFTKEMVSLTEHLRLSAEG